MLKSLVEIYDKLSKRELRVLRIIEAGHKKYEFVPQELVERWSRLRKEQVSEIIRRLHYFGLLRRNLSPYLGWKITVAGYDILAIHTLRVKRKLVKISPTPIGVGKESVVYVGETPSGFKVAIKFHRGGVSVFRYEEAFISRLRKYKHLRQIYETRLSAFAEFFALDKIFGVGGLVPEPIAYNRHVVVMAYIDGIELYRLTYYDFKKVADDIVETLRKALGLGIIHGDLSPYNILVGKRSYIIDWPQWIPASYPNSSTYLKRDLENISSFFKKNGVEIPVDELFKIAEEGRERSKNFMIEINKYVFS